MDSVGRSMEVASKLPPRNQADAFTEVPVLQFAPRLLDTADVNARGRPRLAKGVEVAQHRVEGRIGSSSTGTTVVGSVLARDLVPFFGRRWSETAVLMEPTKAGYDPFSRPPRAAFCALRAHIERRGRAH